MLQEQRRSSQRMAYWWILSLLGLLSLALAACGGPTGAKAPQATATPTATVNTKGAGQIVGATPQSSATPPYAFEGTWTNAPGLPVVGNVGPTAYAFAPSDGRVGYLCSATNGHLYMTRDGGASWSQLRLSATTGCDDVFVDAHSVSDLFVTSASVAQTNGSPTSYDLWRSRDAGAS